MKPLSLEAPASIFLTHFGQAFLLFFLVLALVAGAGELTLFSLILLSMGLGAFAWSRFSLHQVTCELVLDRTRIFPGEKVRMTLQAVNAKWLPVLLKIDVFAPGPVLGTDIGRWISEEAGLLGRQKVVLNRELLPRKRGVYDLGPSRVRGGDLFGFFFKETEMQQRLELVVYPRILPLRTVAVSQKGFYGAPGSRSPVEDPIYLFGTRDYQPGRPARGIHWKASARHHRLQEKLCEPAQQEKVLILLDVGGFEPASAAPDFEKILEVIASLVLQLFRRGVAVGFAANGRIRGDGSGSIPISGNPGNPSLILEALARLTPEKTLDLTEILSKGDFLSWGVSSFHFSGSRSAPSDGAGAFLKRKGIPVRFVFANPAPDLKPDATVSREASLSLDALLASEPVFP